MWSLPHRMKVGSALLTVVRFWALLLLFESNARTVLPNLACFAHDHEPVGSVVAYPTRDPSAACRRAREEYIPFSLQMQRVTPPSSPPSSSASSSKASGASPCWTDFGFDELALLARRPVNLALPPVVLGLFGAARLGLPLVLALVDDESDSFWWLLLGWLRAVFSLLFDRSSISTSDSTAEPTRGAREEPVDVGVGGWRDERRRGAVLCRDHRDASRKERNTHAYLLLMSRKGGMSTEDVLVKTRVQDWPREHRLDRLTERVPNASGPETQLSAAGGRWDTVAGVEIGRQTPADGPSGADPPRSEGT
jgi:hypothetical protein